jgi:hypothetical protein
MVFQCRWKFPSASSNLGYLVATVAKTVGSLREDAVLYGLVDLSDNPNVITRLIQAASPYSRNRGDDATAID